MGKQNFYRLDSVMSSDTQYLALIGERSNGKSFSVKEYNLTKAYYEKNIECKNGKLIPVGEKIKDFEFGYIRRWKEEVTGDAILQYFEDLIINPDHPDAPTITTITNGEYTTLDVYQKHIYFANIDENGKKIRGKRIGHAFYLTGETHYKSLAFPTVSELIFEEFITKSGYLPREVERLESLVSTILRRRRGHVFLIGNTLSRLCPYFVEWGLSHVPKQKQGTIDIYTHYTDQVDQNGEKVIVKIAVEYCENSGNNSQMFFSRKSKMTTGGSWETDSFPHLPEPLEHYKKYYEIKIEWQSFKFSLNLIKKPKEKNVFLFCYPLTKDRNIRRVVSDQFYFDRFATNNLNICSKYDKLVLELVERKKVTFSDNLTGTEFYQMIKEKGGKL